MLSLQKVYLQRIFCLIAPAHGHHYLSIYSQAQNLCHDKRKRFLECKIVLIYVQMTNRARYFVVVRYRCRFGLSDDWIGRHCEIERFFLSGRCNTWAGFLRIQSSSLIC